MLFTPPLIIRLLNYFRRVAVNFLYFIFYFLFFGILLTPCWLASARTSRQG